MSGRMAQNRHRASMAAKRLRVSMNQFTENSFHTFKISESDEFKSDSYLQMRVADSNGSKESF